MGSKVLVVETEAQITRTICSYLEQEGLAPLVVTDSLVAEAELRRQEPDLAILDTESRSVDWRELVGLVWRRSKVPILLLLGTSGKVDKDLGLLIGPGDYLTRPFSQAEFIAVVRRLLRRP
jgi:DNA-binding response OmpR family regulator